MNIMDYRNALPNRIIDRIIEELGCEVNVRKLSQQMKMPVVSLWTKIAHKRKWDADNWLKCMWSLGYARYVYDRKGGYIMLRVPLDTHEIKKLDRMFSEECLIKPDYIDFS
jgi:hypothetical protein